MGVVNFGTGAPAAVATPGSTGGFASPIQPDLAAAAAAEAQSPVRHPATLVALGAAAWLVILYAHFHTY